MRLTDALDRFLVQLDADGRSIHTRRQYERHVGLLDHWLDSTDHAHSIERVNHETVAAFLSSPMARNRPDGKPKKATAMNSLRTSVRTFFRFAHAAGYVAQDPGRLIKRAITSPGPPRSLSVDEQDRLTDILAKGESFEDRRDAVLFGFMLRSGARVGSTVALNVEDVDIHAQEVRIHAKGDRVEKIYLSAETAEQLRTWIGERPDGPLFATRHGGRLTTRQVARRLGQWVEIAGIKRAASPHSLRHSFAMHLYARTHDVLLVKEALRHRSVASTLVYARVDGERLRSALG
ncbi:MAG: tyrosine-type recombinase/integrase [Planctomycetes bacterium]|nr:tyrosine-type recombinase/integrase [Planctomycetota bacterium]MBI3843235.1 tyrosine-type recombinase/integrase [Planctomycetota bacterium]